MPPTMMMIKNQTDCTRLITVNIKLPSLLSQPKLRVMSVVSTALFVLVWNTTMI